MNRQRYGAVFGKPKSYYENSRIIARAERPRVGRYIRIRENGSYIGDWVREQVTGKLGVITDIHPRGWDVVARFKGTDRIGGIFAFDNGQVEVVKNI